MFIVMVNGLCSFNELCACAERPARVEISVEPREITAGYLDSDFVAGQEGVARYPNVDFVTINPAGLNEAWFAL